MTTVEKPGSPYLYIPYTPRGRDFDEDFRHFAFPYFDACETVPYYSSKDAKINTQFCDCMIYAKCQSVEIYHPLTLNVLHKLIRDFNKADITNPSPGMYLRCYLGNIGRTSSMIFIDLMYKDIIFATFIAINVHMNRETIKPMNNCQKLLDYKRQFGRIDNAHNRSVAARSKQFRSAINEISTQTEQFNVDYLQNTIIYSREFELRPLDRDWNKHTNQAVYTKRIEDSLYEYHTGFNQNRYGITYFSHLFKHEMLINNDGSLKCTVNFLMHNKLENGKEEIIGNVCQNDIICLEYQVILTPVKQLKNVEISKL